MPPENESDHVRYSQLEPYLEIQEPDPPGSQKLGQSDEYKTQLYVLKVSHNPQQPAAKADGHQLSKHYA